MRTLLTFFTFAVISFSQVPITVDGSTSVSALPDILNTNFTGAYNGVGAYGISLPATCSPGQKYTLQWVGIHDQGYDCPVANTWRPRGTLASVSAQSGTHVVSTSRTVSLVAGDNVMATCPANKWCNVAVPSTLNAHNDGSSVQYSTGTLTLTNGSTTVTGVGTTFTSGMAPSRIHLTAANVDIYVLTYTNATTLVLKSPWGGATASGLAYTVNYGTVTVSQYLIHNGARFETNTGFLASAPPGTVSDLSCCLDAAWHLDPGDVLGYSASGVGLAMPITLSVSDPLTFSKTVANWNIPVGSPQIVYTCPVGYVCALGKGVAPNLGSLLTANGQLHLWYQGGPAVATVELHVVRGGGATISPSSFAFINRSIAASTRQVAISLNTAQQMSGGDTLVVWCPDTSVTGLAILATVTETPVAGEP